MTSRFRLALLVPARMLEESRAGRNVPAACQAQTGYLLQERPEVATARKLRKFPQEIRGLVAGKEQPLTGERIHQGPVQQGLPAPVLCVTVNAYPGKKE